MQQSRVVMGLWQCMTEQLTVHKLAHTLWLIVRAIHHTTADTTVLTEYMPTLCVMHSSHLEDLHVAVTARAPLLHQPINMHRNAAAGRAMISHHLCGPHGTRSPRSTWRPSSWRWSTAASCTGAQRCGQSCTALLSSERRGLARAGHVSCVGK